MSAGLWTATPGEIPGAAAAQQAQLVVVVAAIDRADQRVTLQAPDGSTENIHVTNPDALQGVQVGDRIAITLTQSVAIALDREPIRVNENEHRSEQRRSNAFAHTEIYCWFTEGFDTADLKDARLCSIA